MWQMQVQNRIEQPPADEEVIGLTLVQPCLVDIALMSCCVLLISNRYRFTGHEDTSTVRTMGNLG